MLTRIAVLVGLSLSLLGSATPSSADPLDGLPLSFESNRGQADAHVRFLARAAGESVFLTGDGVVLALRTEEEPAAVRIVFPDATLDKFSGAGLLPGRTNYLKGADDAAWITGIPQFERVRVENAWDGIAIEFHGDRRRLEYDFIVAAGVDPGRVRFRFDAPTEPQLDEHGALLLQIAGRELRHEKPLAYQEHAGARQAVDVAYRIVRGEVTFELGEYDTSLPLVIDPVVSFATFFGGTGFDEAAEVALDPDGNIYLAGTSYSTDLPTTLGVVQPSYNSGGLPGDVFVAKLDPTASTVLYTTYLGGSREDVATSLAVDTAGNAYIAGHTVSSDFQTTFGAFQRIRPGFSSFPDGFVVKLNASGSVPIFSTYLGGAGSDVIYDLEIDSARNVFVVGSTNSSNFPRTEGAFRVAACPSLGLDGFVAKLNNNASSLAYSTLLCGSETDEVTGIAVDAQGAAYVTGFTRSDDFPVAGPAPQPAADPFSRDAFATKLNPSGSALVYSTFLGGTADDFGSAIAVDADGDAYVVGSTRSTDLVVTPGAFQAGHADNGLFGDGFVTMLNPAGSAFVYSTYLGGSGIDHATAIAVDDQHRAYVAGHTASADFPSTAGRCQTAFGGGSDAFVARLDAGGSALDYSLYLGGTGDDAAAGIAVDAAGGAVVAGGTASRNFPTTPNALRAAYANGYRGATDAFISRITDSPSPVAPCIALNGIVNGASFLPGPLAPGEIVSIFGDGLGPVEAKVFTLVGDRIDASLAGTRVLFEGNPAPVIATSNGQVNVIVPYSVAGKQQVLVEVDFQGQRTQGVTVPIAALSPAVFSLDRSGQGQGAVLNQDFSVNGAGNPAAKGSVIQIFATGEGQTNPAGIDGRLAPNSVNELPSPKVGVAVIIGGIPAIVQYAGAAPGLVAGLIQVNAFVPASVASGNVVPVLVYFGDNSSPAGVTVAIE